LVAIGWGFGAAIVLTVLPLTESAEDINMVLSGMYYALMCKEAPQAIDPATLEAKEAEEIDDATPEKAVEEPAPAAEEEA
jgi:hypothetical protein